MHCYRNFFFAACLLLPSVLKAQKEDQQIISVETELKYISDISLLPSYRSNTIEAQVSTYDTTGGNDDGFNGTYSFVKRKRN